MEKIIKKNAPLGVKVISIMGIILGILGILVTPLEILTISLGRSSSSTGMSTAETYFALIIFILPAILIILLSVMLLKRKNWARITTAIFFLLIVILTIADQSRLFKQWMNLRALYYINIPLAILGLLISIYLIFSKKVREAFA